MPSRPTAPPYGERRLHLDPPCSGRDVWELQIKLIAWGSGSNREGVGAPFMPVRVHGAFDLATQGAVRRFQRALALPVTGEVDAATFRAIDREAALFPVLVHPMRCRCAAGKNAGLIHCRCNDHPNEGVCTGFGNARFGGQYRLDGARLLNGKSLAGEKLDVYDKKEYPGIDKALLWAVRGLMRRSTITRLQVVAGYQCWHDNYHSYSGNRWSHRTSTFHLGKTLQFQHEGTCLALDGNVTDLPCAECQRIRTAALDLCGFQPRFQEPDRVSVGDFAHNAPPPRSPFSVLVSTVRRRNREDDEFVKSYHDSLLPLYPERAPGLSFPLQFAGTDSLDPLQGPAQKFFVNSESRPGGRFPIGPSRTWHTGVHLFAAAGTQVRAIADGELVACRAGEAEALHPQGSRNFVLLRHRWKGSTWYSLYMHLDNGAVNAASVIEWRKKLHLLTLRHVQMDKPCPLFTTQPLPPPPAPPLAPSPGTRLRAECNVGLGAGEWRELAAAAAETDPLAGGAAALDAKAPANSLVIRVAAPANHYIYTQMESHVLGRVVAADGGVQAAINANNAMSVPSPIPVRAGELIGSIAGAPTNALLAPMGACLHLEVFADHPLMTGEGITAIDAPSDNGMIVREAAESRLRAAGLLAELPSHVLLESDFNDAHGLDQLALRSTQLHCPSAWQIDWKAALAASAARWHMAPAARDTLGDEMNQYRWWLDVQGGNHLPASHVVWHAHPITWLMHMATEMAPPR